MRARLLIAAAMFAAGLGVGGGAYATTVTFDDSAGNALLGSFDPHEVDLGLAFDGSHGCCGVFDTENGNQQQGNGTNNYIFGLGPSMSIARAGGGLFDLTSADFTLSWYTSPHGSAYDLDPELASDTITLTGTTSGGPITQTLTLVQGFTTYSLSMFGVSQVEVSAVSTGENSYWAMDNLVYEAVGGGVGGVPEPTTWALSILGMGLAGAAIRDRRSRRIAV